MKSASAFFAMGILASGLAVKPALSATSTASFGVSVTVVDTCRVASAAKPLGNYAAAVADPTSAVSVYCTNNTQYNVSLRAGLTAMTAPDMAGFNPSARGDAQLVASEHPVNRDRTVGSKTINRTVSDSSAPLIVNGRTVETQSDASSDYPDSVLITVTY